MSNATGRHCAVQDRQRKCAVSSGIRRIEALTGEAARQWLVSREDKLKEAAATLRSAPEDVPLRIAALVEGQRKLERELADAKKALALGGGISPATGTASATSQAIGVSAEAINGVRFSGRTLVDFDPKGLRSLLDEAKSTLGSGVAAVVTVVEGRASVAVGVTDDLKDRLNAVELVRAAVAVLGGQGGGGRPDMAQGGGPDGAKAQAAIDAVRAAMASAPVLA